MKETKNKKVTIYGICVAVICTVLPVLYILFGTGWEEKIFPNVSPSEKATGYAFSVKHADLSEDVSLLLPMKQVSVSGIEITDSEEAGHVVLTLVLSDMPRFTDGFVFTMYADTDFSEDVISTASLTRSAPNEGTITMEFSEPVVYDLLPLEDGVGIRMKTISEYAKVVYCIADEEETRDFTDKLAGMNRVDSEVYFLAPEKSEVKISDNGLFSEGRYNTTAAALITFGMMHEMFDGVKISYNAGFAAPKKNSLSLAEMMMNAVSAYLGGEENAIVTEKDTESLVYMASCPAINVRLCDLTDSKLMSIWSQENFRTEVANAVWEATENWLRD